MLGIFLTIGTSNFILYPQLLAFTQWPRCPLLCETQPVQNRTFLHCRLPQLWCLQTLSSLCSPFIWPLTILPSAKQSIILVLSFFHPLHAAPPGLGTQRHFCTALPSLGLLKAHSSLGPQQPFSSRPLSSHSVLGPFSGPSYPLFPSLPLQRSPKLSRVFSPSMPDTTHSFPLHFLAN